MVEIVICCRLQFGDGTIAIVLVFGWTYSDGNSRFAIGMVEIEHNEEVNVDEMKTIRRRMLMLCLSKGDNFIQPLL
jgi:hypothetical protein